MTEIVLLIVPGAAAIWEGDDVGDLPLTNPGDYWDRLRFHSGAYYAKIIDVQTVTVNFPAMAADENREHTYTLFAHGRSGTPVVKGRATIGGEAINIAGHVPIQSGYHTLWFGRPYGVYSRFVALGADDTNVILHEYAKAPRDTGYSSLSLDVTVYVWEEIIEDGAPDSPEETDLRPEYWRLGLFDSRFPYLYEDASPQFALVAGPTLAMGYSGGSFCWGYKVGSYEVAQFPTDGTSDEILPTNTTVQARY